MKRDEVNTIYAVLKRIKDPDAKVRESIAICEKQIANYDSRIGQIKESYETEYRGL